MKTDGTRIPVYIYDTYVTRNHRGSAGFVCESRNNVNERRHCKGRRIVLNLYEIMYAKMYIKSNTVRYSRGA